jgi:hypothetical protein
LSVRLFSFFFLFDSFLSVFLFLFASFSFTALVVCGSRKQAQRRRRMSRLLLLSGWPDGFLNFSPKMWPNLYFVKINTHDFYRVEKVALWFGLFHVKTPES